MSCRSLLYCSLLDRQRKRWNKSCVDRKNVSVRRFELSCVYFRSVVKNVRIGEKATIWSTEFGQFREVILLINGKIVHIFHNITIVIDKILRMLWKSMGERFLFVLNVLCVKFLCVRMCVFASQRISAPTKLNVIVDVAWTRFCTFIHLFFRISLFE